MGLWKDMHAATIDVENFRGHNQYLEQRDDLPYEALLAEVERAGSLMMLDHLGEDGAFGCVTRTVGERVLSRDLLDSVIEMTYLSHRFEGGLPKRVLDVGAGYGRFAHRYCAAHPRATVTCTDMIDVSRAVCGKYLRHRGCDRATVAHPTELHPDAYDLAVNIHSWSECTYEEVAWWVATLADLRVPNLFLIPHTPTLGTWDRDLGGGNGPSFRGALETAYTQVDEYVGPACWPRVFTLWEAKR